MVAYLKGKTLAANDVLDADDLQSSSRRTLRAPYLLIAWEGDIQEQHNTTHPTGRITTEFYGRTPKQGKYGARQIREALLTPGDSTGGVHAVITYHDDEEDANKTITLSGARLESGPREGPDQRERIITTYLVDYY